MGRSSIGAAREAGAAAVAPARLATSCRLGWAGLAWLGRAYHLRARAYWKHDSAKPRIDSSVLYIPMATPAPAAQAVQVVAVQGSVVVRGGSGQASRPGQAPRVAQRDACSLCPSQPHHPHPSNPPPTQPPKAQAKRTLEVVDCELLGLAAVCWGEGHLELAGALHNHVGGAVLVTKRVPAAAQGVLPVFYSTQNRTASQLGASCRHLPTAMSLFEPGPAHTAQHPEAHSSTHSVHSTPTCPRRWASSSRARGGGCCQ